MKLISGHSSLCSIKPITTSKIGKLMVVCLFHILEFYFFLKTHFLPFLKLSSTKWMSEISGSFALDTT